MVKSEALRFDFLRCIVMISTGPQSLVAPRDEEMLVAYVTLLLNLKLCQQPIAGWKRGR